MTEFSAAVDQAHVSMSLARALAAHVEAKLEAAHWTRVCADWTAACGKSVWREGHPSDREKLRQRRLWRRYAANSGEWLRHVLSNEPPAGCA